MKSLCFLILFTLIFKLTFSQTNDQRLTHWNHKRNLAIEGYDPVSYFQKSPKEGESKHAFKYKGLTYHFVSQGNLLTFKNSPSIYEPAYGGWCAYAMGTTGEKVKVDPKTYKIIDGKLYLFYNFWTNNTLTGWNMDEDKLKAAADKNWSQILR